MPRAPVRLAVLVIALAAGASVTWGQEDVVVPVYKEPKHRQVFESGTTRILNVQVKPGETSLFHTHAEPILYVVFSNGRLRTQALGGEWPAPRPAEDGSAPARPLTPEVPDTPRVTSTASYVDKPVTHRVNNVGTKIFHNIAVLNATAGNDKATEQQTGFEGTPELTNPWFRAYRFTLAPGAQPARHMHTTPAVVVQTSTGLGVGAGAKFWALDSPSAWAYFDAGDSHELRNTGSVPLELVEIEVRQPTP